MTWGSGEHVHCAALAALLAHVETKAQVATIAAMTPSNLRELETGARSGASIRTRARVAEALGVNVLAVTCWCDRPDGRCRSYSEDI